MTEALFWLLKNLPLIAILIWLWGHAKAFWRMRTFRKIFGKGIRNSDDIVVSVPLWRAIEGKRHIPRFETAGRGALYGPDEMYNRQDMFAAAHVLNVLNTHLDKEVKYSNDWDTPDWDQKTLVLIGSSSANSHARYYLKVHAERRPDDVFPCFLEFTGGETNELGALVCIHDRKSGKEYRSDNDWDYGLVLRLPNVLSKGSDHFVFLVAGIHEWSTREAGRLFNARWSTLGQEGRWRRFLRLVRPWKWYEPSPPAGFVFRMKPKVIGTGNILEEARQWFSCLKDPPEKGPPAGGN